MADSLVLVRHATPVVDAAVDPAAWALSDGGRSEAWALGRHLRQVLDAPATTPSEVAASTEPKAVATAEALELGRMRTDDRLGEVRRPWLGDADVFRAEVHRYLRGDMRDGWEPMADAAARFDGAVRELADGTVMVTHGTVASAWLASRLGDVDPVAFWQDLRMPDAWHVDLTTGTLARLSP